MYKREISEVLLTCPQCHRKWQEEKSAVLKWCMHKYGSWSQ